jgi:hypothetical protein
MAQARSGRQPSLKNSKTVTVGAQPQRQSASTAQSVWSAAHPAAFPFPSLRNFFSDFIAVVANRVCIG